MESTHDATPTRLHTRNPLNYVLIALGILLLVLGLPVLFATSAVSKMIGDALGQTVTMAILGLLIIVSGATMLAIGLRRR